jgi:hypothetical protein
MPCYPLETIGEINHRRRLAIKQQSRDREKEGQVFFIVVFPQVFETLEIHMQALSPFRKKNAVNLWP